MRKQDAQDGIERFVAAKFPALVPIGDLLVGRDRHVLRGFAFERSQLDKTSFRLKVFVQVLSIPADHLNFGLGKDLGEFRGENGFAKAADQAQTEGVEFLALASSCRDIAENIGQLANPLSDERLAREAGAHCLIHSGEEEAAKRELEAIERSFGEAEQIWERAALSRVGQLREKLKRSREAAEELLEDWEDQTASALSVSDLPSESP